MPRVSLGTTWNNSEPHSLLPIDAGGGASDQSQIQYLLESGKSCYARVTFSADGSRVVCCTSADLATRVWDVASGQMVAQSRVQLAPRPAGECTIVHQCIHLYLCSLHSWAGGRLVSRCMPGTNQPPSSWACRSAWHNLLTCSALTRLRSGAPGALAMPSSLAVSPDGGLVAGGEEGLVGPCVWASDTNTPRTMLAGGSHRE